MVNPEKIHGLLRNLGSSLDQLRKIAQMDQKRFLGDALASGAAKYYLQTAIEACIDIGNHIISSEGYRAPRDYRDVFTVLEENGLVTGVQATKLRQMAGLRNRLVHLYWEIDDELVFQYLQTNLNDFDEYNQAVLKFMRLTRPG
jgi:uncharacterized protein YutE (UPF0331/DUF86 family)